MKIRILYHQKHGKIHESSLEVSPEVSFNDYYEMIDDRLPDADLEEDERFIIFNSDESMTLNDYEDEDEEGNSLTFSDMNDGKLQIVHIKIVKESEEESDEDEEDYYDEESDEESDADVDLSKFDIIFDAMERHKFHSDKCDLVADYLVSQGLSYELIKDADYAGKIFIKHGSTIVMRVMFRIDFFSGDVPAIYIDHIERVNRTSAGTRWKGLGETAIMLTLCLNPDVKAIPNLDLEAVSFEDDYAKLFKYYETLGLRKVGDEKETSTGHTQKYSAKISDVIDIIASRIASSKKPKVKGRI